MLQTVFVRLLRRQSFDDTVEKQESYLRRAAINAALDIVRARQPDRTLELVDMPSSHTPTDDQDLRDALARALSKLPSRSAEAFTLRFLEGFANAEIARMLGISQVLVAVIIHRTRRQLRKELATYLGDKS